MRRTISYARSCLAIIVPLALSSCTLDKPKPTAPEKVGDDTESILGGTTDSTNSSVVFITNNSEACSGTIISINGSFGYVLTAAHCANMTEIVYMPPGVTSIQSQQAQAFSVDQDTVDPLFTDPSQGHDFRILRFSGANAGMAVTPAASTDSLAPPDSIELSGFGLTMPGGQASSTRMHVTVATNSVDSTFIQYPQTNGKGACNGDSGGPAFFTVGGTKEVVGATSFGDQNCTQYGVSGHVSLVDYNSFIAPTIGAAVMETCDSCSASALASGGACFSQVTTCENEHRGDGLRRARHVLERLRVGQHDLRAKLRERLEQRGHQRVQRDLHVLELPSVHDALSADRLRHDDVGDDGGLRDGQRRRRPRHDRRDQRHGRDGRDGWRHGRGRRFGDVVGESFGRRRGAATC